MAKNPSIEELDDVTKFTRELKLAYEDVAVFVMSHLKNRTAAMIAFWVVTAGSVILNITLWLKALRTPVHHSMITGTILGFILIPVALAPLHEAIHYIFMRISGARDIRLGMDLRQGIIYLSAHKHVIGKRSFRVIATSPFIMVNILFAALIFLSASIWLKWVLSAALLMHATMCVGDLVLLGYMEEFKPRPVYTWDDVDAKEAYFYVSVN
jgi:hypothetical protein